MGWSPGSLPIDPRAGTGVYELSMRRFTLASSHFLKQGCQRNESVVDGHSSRENFFGVVIM